MIGAIVFGVRGIVVNGNDIFTEAAPKASSALDSDVAVLGLGPRLTASIVGCIYKMCFERVMMVETGTANATAPLFFNTLFML